MLTIENYISYEIVQKIGWVLLHFIWQAAAVAIVLAFALRILRRFSANLRYIAACLTLMLIVALPLITMQFIEVEAPSPAVMDVEAAPEPIVTLPGPTIEVERAREPQTITYVRPEPVVTKPRINWKQKTVSFLEPKLPDIVTIWLLGVFAFSIWHLGGYAQLQRLRKKMVKQVDASLNNKLKILSQKLGVRQTVQLLESALVQIPTVVGWMKPVILLPASALTGLSTEQLEAILAHELAHIKRYDYLVNMLQTIVEILGFYHPAVWWISHKIRTERENCCDDIAVSISGNKINYAKALTLMEEIRGRRNFAVAATGGNLFSRIRRLLVKDSSENNSFSWLPALTVILLLIALAIPTTIAFTSSQNENESSNADKIDSKTKVLIEAQVIQVNNEVLEKVGLDDASLKNSDKWTQYRVDDSSKPFVFAIGPQSREELIKSMDQIQDASSTSYIFMMSRSDVSNKEIDQDNAGNTLLSNDQTLLILGGKNVSLQDLENNTQILRNMPVKDEFLNTISKTIAEENEIILIKATPVPSEQEVADSGTLSDDIFTSRLIRIYFDLNLLEPGQYVEIKNRSKREFTLEQVATSDIGKQREDFPAYAAYIAFDIRSNFDLNLATERYTNSDVFEHDTWDAAFTGANAITGSQKFSIITLRVSAWNINIFSASPVDSGNDETQVSHVAVIIKPDNKQSGTASSNSFEGEFETGRDIPVTLEAGQDGTRSIINAEYIRFEENGPEIKPVLTVNYRRGKGFRWQAEIELLDAGGKTFAQRQTKPSGEGITSGQPIVIERQIEFLPFNLDEIQNASRFRISYEQLEPLLDEIGRPYDETRTDWIEGKVTDPNGLPISDAIILVNEDRPGASSFRIARIATDENGYYRFGAVDWPYKLGAEWQRRAPAGQVEHFQTLRFNEVLRGSQKIDFHFDVFPQGTSSILGQAQDQNGQAVQEYKASLIRDTPDSSNNDFTPSFWINKQVKSEDGAFKFVDVPAGDYRVWIIPDDKKRYEWPLKEVELTANKTTVVDVEVLSKHKLYGRVLFEDGKPAVVKPTPWTGAKTSILMPFGSGGMSAGIGTVDDEGYFVVYLEQNEYNMLKSGEASLRINVPAREEHYSKTAGEFPFELLSENRETAGVVKISREGTAPQHPTNESAGETIDKEEQEKLEKKVISAQNMKWLGLAVVMYADDNNGKMPDTMDVLKPYFNDEQVFQWVLANVKYIGGGTIKGRDAAKTPIAFDNKLQEPDGTNFLFLDGHVEFRPIEEYQDFLLSRKKVLIEMKLLEVSDKFLKEEATLKELLKNATIPIAGMSIPQDPNKLLFSTALLDDSQIDSLFKRDSDTLKMLAAPKLLVFDNEPAQISTVTEIPYVSGYTEPNNLNEISIPIIGQKDIGFTGTFTPHITPDNNDIVMEYELKNSFVASYEERTFDANHKDKVPLISQREMTSTILISRGKTLVANMGEVKSEENKSDSSQEKKELLVLIKPTIVSPEQTKTQDNVINSNDTDMIGPPVGEFIINTSEYTRRVKEQESTGISVSQPDPLQLLDENDKVIYNQLEQNVDLSHINPSMTFEQVLEEFKKLTDPPLKIQPNWRDLSDKANITPITPAEMEPLRDIKIRTALDILSIGLSSKQFRISYTIHEGVILIATADSLPTNLVQRTYDISDLAILLPGINRNFNSSNDSNGIISGFKGEMGYDGISKYSIVKSVPELVNFIMKLIEPDSWYENKEKAQGTIYPYPASAPKKLAITNTPEVHFKIEKFLNMLRESIDTTQVSVEMRYLYGSEQSINEILNSTGIGKIDNTMLNDTQVESLLRATLKDKNIESLYAPKVTVLNGETAQITELRTIPGNRSVDTFCRITPIVSGEKKNVIIDFTQNNINFGQYHTGTISLTNITVPNGKAFAFSKVINNQDVSSGDKKSLTILIKPTIIPQEEAKDNIPGEDAFGTMTGGDLEEAPLIDSNQTEDSEQADANEVLIETQILHVSNAFLEQVGLDDDSLENVDVWTHYRVKELNDSNSFIIDSLSADLLLKAIQERRGDHIIARPKVMVNDGKQTSIEVKTEDVQLSKLDVEANPSIAESIRKRFGGLNAGTFINLTPQIVENNNVRLDAKLNVRDVVSPSTELKINGVIIQKGRTLKEKEDTSKEKLSVVTVFEKSLNALVPNSDSLLILGPEITRSTSREARHSLINLPILDRLFTIQGGYRIVDEYTILILIKPTIVLTEQNE